MCKAPLILSILLVLIGGCPVLGTPYPPYGSAGNSTLSNVTPRPLLSDWPLIDERNRPVHPINILEVGSSLYFLTPDALRVVPEGKSLLSVPQALHLRLLKPGESVGEVPIQEFMAFTYCAGRKSLVVLDKAGDLFEFFPNSNRWSALRPNREVPGYPDPEFMGITAADSQIFLLDPECNQIWKLPPFSARRSALFRKTVPWRLKAGDPNVTDALALAYDRSLYVLKPRGRISRYEGGLNEKPLTRVAFPPLAVQGRRPTSLTTGPDLPLYIVERDNNRVSAANKMTGEARVFLFPSDSDLRGLLPVADGFFILNGDHLTKRELTAADSPKEPPHRRSLDPRLDGLVLPLTGVRLPHHPGVYPGARRLYRFGVHQGVDFFDSAGGPARVEEGTPVGAADAGRVIRADQNFRDLNYFRFNQVMHQCLREHSTSESNENLFRGCQVWIDHGHGLTTRYAHLSKVKSGLKPGDYVCQGDIIGYVGVSGTGENLPGRAKHPHLHFEIWLDGRYLGWGLTPAETICLLEDIFGRSH